MRASVVFLCCALACAGTAPSRTHYLLRADAAEQTARADAPVQVGLRRVAIAGYLDQAGIVVEEAPGQVKAAQLHLWAEPLEESLHSYLRTSLSQALGFDVSIQRANESAWDYAVDVYVDLLHAKMDGTAVIDASYQITRHGADGVRVERRFARSARLPRQGYPGIVDAEASLVSDLASAIAAALEELRGAR